MKLPLLGCLLLLLATDALAHRLDEYLQVTRVSVATNRIDLTIDLTPGVSVASQVLNSIDRDHDGQISGKEAAVYAERVIADFKVRFDEKPMALTVAEASFPSIPEIKVGVGVIRLKVSAPVDRLLPGSHALDLTNAHLPAISVYQVNALVPKDPAITIQRQTRDELQKDYRLEFRLKPACLKPPVPSPVQPDQSQSSSISTESMTPSNRLSDR